MTFIVQEIQTTNGATALVTPTTYTDRNQAEAKYHLILASAATSQVEEHTALIMTQDGRVVRTECYKHYPAPAPEPEPEPEPEVEEPQEP